MAISPPVRARDLRSNIQEMGFERGVVHTLELLMDEFTAFRQSMRDMARIQGQCIDRLDDFITIGDGMKKQIDDFIRLNKQGDEHDS